MSEQLRYDPRSKKLIKDRLYQFLYAPVEEHFQKRLDTIIQKNSKLWGNAQRRMDYRGELYEVNKPGPADRHVNRCHADIRPLMKDYLEDLNELNQTEIPYVVGYINKVLNKSESMADYKKLLPESVHAPLNILTFPCNTELLQPDQIKQLQENHHQAVMLMKKRMVENLLL